MTGAYAISYLIGRGWTPQQANHAVSAMESKHSALDAPSLVNFATRMAGVR